MTKYIHPFFKLYDEETRVKAMQELWGKVESAYEILGSQPFEKEGLYIGHSGGKDSVVVTTLATNRLGDLPVLHTAKPKGENAVHPDAQKIVYELGASRSVLLYPRDTPPPTGYDTQIDGTKRCEHDRTDGRHTDVLINGQLVSRKDMPAYVTNGLFRKNFIFPLYDWEDYHVWALIYSWGLSHSAEYDEV